MVDDLEFDQITLMNEQQKTNAQVDNYLAGFFGQKLALGRSMLNKLFESSS